MSGRPVDPGVAAGLAARATARSMRRRALLDPVLFQAAVMRDEVTGRPFAPADIHCEWQDLCTQHDRLVLEAAIEHGKSSSISIGRVLYEIAKNPNIRVLIVSNTGGHSSLGVKILSAIKKYVERSPDLREVAPNLVPAEPWTQTSITVRRTVISKDPTVQVCGSGGDIMGARVDLCIFDDVCDFENTRTKDQRDKLVKWIESTVLGRLTDSARVWVLGNPWHPDDAYARLAAKPGWVRRTFRSTDDRGQPVWPEKWSPERLQKKREDLGPTEAARQLDCRSRSDEDARFKSEYVQRCLVAGHGRNLASALRSIPAGYRVITGVDLAVQERDDADETCLFTCLMHPNGCREVLNIEAGRWGGPVIIERILDHYRRYGGIFVVENNAAQDYLIQFTHERAAVPILPYTTGRSKAHPEFGIEKVAAEMAAGKWIIPNVGGVSHPEVDKWVQECLYYHPAAHTGDRLMASWFVTEGEKLLNAGGKVTTWRWSHAR